jgi:hypothetical protein
VSRNISTALTRSINRVVDGQAELGENRIDVLFHRPLRQHQPLRHDAIAEPGCQFGEHLAFAGDQPASAVPRLHSHCGDPAASRAYKIRHKLAVHWALHPRPAELMDIH